MAQSAEVLLPASEREAVDAFGDGSGITVVAGGTIVVPDLTYGRQRPERRSCCGTPGSPASAATAGASSIGAMTRVADLLDAPEPLASAARGVADREVRNAATIGGNLCAGEGNDAPRGDLQAPLIALGAEVRSAGAGGERTEPVEDFLAGSPADRLVLSIAFAAPARAGYARFDRPHAHTYTILAVSATAGAGGLDDLRIAVSGVGPHAVRLPAAEDAARGPVATTRRRSPTCSRATTRWRPAGTARGSCPTSSLAPSRASPDEGARHEAGRERRRAGHHEPSADAPAAGPARGARAHRRQGRLPAGRLRHVHRAGRRRAAPRLPDAARQRRGRLRHHAGGRRHARRPRRRVQAAFNEHYAAQCGFCTPGFVLATTALLEHNPSPDRDEILEALGGHICRCTGYAKILNAVEDLAGATVHVNGGAR